MAVAKRKPAVTKTATARFRVIGKDEASSAGPKRLNLGSLKKTTEKKSDHPIVEVGEEALALLDQFVELAPEYQRLDKLVGSKGSIKIQLAPHIKKTYFTRFAGSAPESSTMLVAVTGRMVKLTVKKRYSTKCSGTSALIAALGEPIVGQHFHQATVLKIDMDKIAEEKQQPFVDAILAAAKKFRIENGITATECVQPKVGFHEARTLILTPEQNMAVDEIIPITAYAQL